MSEALSPISCNDDSIFEPTIDMMVNDFDDEQTLNEEENLAVLDPQNPQDEVETLLKEGEMPLEELLAKYHCSELYYGNTIPKNVKGLLNQERVGTILEKSDSENSDQTYQLYENNTERCSVQAKSSESSYELDEYNKHKNDLKTSRKSYLRELYVDQDTCSKNNFKGDFEDFNEQDTGYGRKTIMVGVDYQAFIPIGLLHYGDILPYENEDKLVWEPSQASESEVEDFLLKVRSIKRNLTKPNTKRSISAEENFSKTETEKNFESVINENSEPSLQDEVVSDSKNNQSVGVVKDNEQALHLLVQCGYDFKEALRRRQINAMPITETMSLWSEDECRKFEEGIQKYGKDFFKIRKNLIRTRSMRELVQFYYLWKKSERRDKEFSKSDTVNHMDMYLNGSGDYGVKPPLEVGSSNFLSNMGHVSKQKRPSAPKNFSIMTGGSAISTSHHPSNLTNKKKGISNIVSSTC